MSYQSGKSNRVESPALSFTARVEPEKGLWACIPHLVGDHPIFAGLPVAGMMREIYENVWATQTLRDLDGEAIVASIGFDWFSHGHKMHYSGPGESWWDADLAVVPHWYNRRMIPEYWEKPELLDGWVSEFCGAVPMMFNKGRMR